MWAILQSYEGSPAFAALQVIPQTNLIRCWWENFGPFWTHMIPQFLHITCFCHVISFQTSCSLSGIWSYAVHGGTQDSLFGRGLRMLPGTSFDARYKLLILMSLIFFDSSKHQDILLSWLLDQPRTNRNVQPQHQASLRLAAVYVLFLLTCDTWPGHHGANGQIQS